MNMRLSESHIRNGLVCFLLQFEKMTGEIFAYWNSSIVRKRPKMVQYVLNWMDENLFVSKYMLQLPEKEEMEEFIIKKMKELGV